MQFPMVLAAAVNADGDTGAPATGPAATGPAVTVVAPGTMPGTMPGTAPAGGAVVVAGGGAVTGTPTTTPTTLTSQPAREPSFLERLGPIPMIVLLVVVFYFFMFRGPRKEEKARKAQLSSMKKGDEVLLISGKFGTVVDVKEDRVVVKVDETNNVKETYLKSAIQKVIRDDDVKKDAKK